MKRNALTYLLLPFLLALLVTACKDDTLPASPAEEEEAGSGVYVSVVVNTGGSNASRVPTPGEDGDLPKQPGTGDENMVHDLNVFFFQTSDGKGLNTNDNASSISVIPQYFENLMPAPSGTITRYITSTEEVENLNIGETYEVLVVANAGEKSLNDISTLEDLRKKSVTQAIEEPNSDNNGLKFLMASAGPEVNTITIENNSKNNPAIVSVEIERLVARVDYKINQSYTTTSGDKVEIQSATLVNKHETPPYVFKRVSQDVDNLSNIIYLGNETVTNNVASNYVLDYFTNNNDLTQRIYGIKFADFDIWNSPNVWKELQVSTDYTKLDYTEENIVIADVVEENRSTYCTGIVFKAQYIPKGFENKENNSFYWYNGKAYSLLSEIGNPEITEDNYDDYGIIYYLGGICYYTYWIRHADDGNPDVISPMEYAIVRNNIYQLDVKSISTIGPPVPEDNINATIEVYVVNWEEIDTEDVVWGDPVSSN